MSMKVSLDGGKTFVEVTEGVRVVYEGVMVPGEDSPGELHLNLTQEGVVSDLWASREEQLDHNLGTSSQLVEDLVERLVDDPVSNDEPHGSAGADGEVRWHQVVNQQGWNDATEIIHLEGFLRDKGLFDQFADYAEVAAAEENSMTMDDQPGDRA